jgi:hypothetical protein
MYIKGQDYDFSAVRDDEQVNVEVTTLAEKEFNPKTIPSSLSKKCKQVPNTSPAIIFVALPVRWASERRDWDFYLMKVACDFFRWTRRINAVVFIGERYFDADKPGTGGFALINKTYANPNPRIPMQNMNFLFGPLKDVPSLKQAMLGIPLTTAVIESDAP